MLSPAAIHPPHLLRYTEILIVSLDSLPSLQAQHSQLPRCAGIATPNPHLLYNAPVLHHLSPSVQPYNFLSSDVLGSAYHLLWECVHHSHPLPFPHHPLTTHLPGAVGERAD